NAARSTIADIDLKLAQTQAALSEHFPGYAELASPKPLALQDAQAMLGEGQALVLFVDNGRIGEVPEETIIFAVTKHQARWKSIPEGTGALRDRVAALRCGLDATQWLSGGEGRQACERLLTAQAIASMSNSKLPPFDLAIAHHLYRMVF